MHSMLYKYLFNISNEINSRRQFSLCISYVLHRLYLSALFIGTCRYKNTVSYTWANLALLPLIFHYFLSTYRQHLVMSRTRTHTNTVLGMCLSVCAVWCGNRSPAPSAQAKFLSRSPLPLLKSLASPESSTALSLWHAASACRAVAVLLPRAVAVAASSSYSSAIAAVASATSGCGPFLILLHVLFAL